MNKKHLIEVINSVLVPLGFKQENNFWLHKNEGLIKIVNLQKAKIDQLFYINYGYIFKEIPLENETMHVYNRLASTDPIENDNINKLLDLDTKITDQERSEALKKFLNDKIVSEFKSVNTKIDVITGLKKRNHLNNISLGVKKYLQLI